MQLEKNHLKMEVMKQICNNIENIQIVFPNAVLSILLVNYCEDLVPIQKSNIIRLHFLKEICVKYYDSVGILPLLPNNRFRTQKK